MPLGNMDNMTPEQLKGISDGYARAQQNIKETGSVNRLTPAQNLSLTQVPNNAEYEKQASQFHALNAAAPPASDNQDIWSKAGITPPASTTPAPVATPAAPAVDGSVALKAQIEATNAAHLKSQLAQLEINKTNQLAALQKSFDEAVSNGQMSVLEAKAAFAKQAEQINQQNYQSAEDTSFLANQRGIGNSQQMLGMVASDTARGNTLNNSNMQSRDSTLAAIKNRIDLLTTQKASDVNTLNQNYDSSVVQATADSQYNASNQAFQLDLGNYNAARDFKYGQQRDATQQGYAQQNAATQQGYTQTNMATQNQFQTAAQKADFQQQSDMMTKQAGITVDQMKVKLGIDKELSAYTSDLDLMKMAKNHGYDMEKLKASAEYQAAQSAAHDKRAYDQAIDVQIAKHKNDKANAADDYQAAVTRELAKYTPGTPEYSIKQSQMAEGFAKNQQTIDQKLQNDILTSRILKDPNLDVTGDFTAPKDLNDSTAVSTYNAKVKAFNTFNDATGNKKDNKMLLPTPKQTSIWDDFFANLGHGN